MVRRAWTQGILQSRRFAARSSLSRSVADRARQRAAQLLDAPDINDITADRVRLLLASLERPEAAGDFVPGRIDVHASSAREIDELWERVIGQNNG